MEHDEWEAAAMVMQQARERDEPLVRAAAVVIERTDRQSSSKVHRDDGGEGRRSGAPRCVLTMEVGIAAALLFCLGR